MSTAEISRRQSAMLRFGRVTEVKGDTARARVQFEEGHQSGWLRWFAQGAGPGETSWHAPNVGEEVMVLAPDGTLETGVILRGLYGLGDKAPFSADLKLSGVLHADAGIETYDSETHEKRIVLPIGGVAIIDAAGTWFEVRDGRIRAEVGSSTLLIEDGKITLDASNILLKGDVDLGDEGGSDVARKDDPVANGVITAGSSKVRSAG
tara:strand:+ start:6328 stop:6948 length:621 start_codon:yes stop_codon:yes gene_type:complete